MSTRRLPLVIATGTVAAIAAAASVAQGPLMRPNPTFRPTQVDPVRVQLDPSAMMTAEIGRLSRDLKQVQLDLKQTQGQLDQTRADLKQAQNQLGQMSQPGSSQQLADDVYKLKGNYAVLADKFAHHTHVYSYQTVKYWNRNFVTEGRPIVKDEKKDYGSFIENTPTVVEETKPPLLH